MEILTEAEYREYIAAFNRSDFAAFSRYYAPGVEFQGRAGHFHGRDAVVAFYRQAHARLRERIEIQQIIRDERGLVADLVTELQALEDWPEFPTGPIARGEIRRSQNFVWYEFSGKQFSRVRAAHYRRGTVLDHGPAVATDSPGDVQVSPEAFAKYIDAFNRGDDMTYGDFYAPDVILVIAGKHELRGRQSIVDFYKTVKAQTRRTIQVNRLISSPGALAAELQSEFTALEDLPEFAGGPLGKGDRLFINTVVLYDVRDGRFTRIRSAQLRKLHRPREPQKIVVVEYDDAWPSTFANLAAPISEVLRGIALSVEHVGSTSIPGLPAKPIIDIDVVVPTRAELAATVARLASLGYVHRGNLGIADREAFESPGNLPPHHLYACVRGSTALANHLAIRDYLRRNPAAAAAYGELKMQLAGRFPMDRESYVSGKTDFLLQVLRSAGFSEEDLRTIRGANRK